MTPCLKKHVAQANAHGTQLFPDELEVLAEICRKIDEEQNSQFAWKMVSDFEANCAMNRPEEFDELHHAVADNVQSSTIAYINLKSGKSATGILVEIDDRFFMATTAHSLPRSPVGNVSFVGRIPKPIDASAPCILSHGRDDNEELKDIAFLEIGREYTMGLAETPISLSRILPCGAGQEKHLAFVCGYPTEFVQDVNIHQGASGKQFAMLSWTNKLLMPNQWDVLPQKRRFPDPSVDVFLPWPRNDDVQCHGLHQVESLVEPYGLSGGGYWQLHASSNRAIWTAENYCLIAIQSEWWELGRYLQATQIVHWLRLLWNQKAELRPTLELAFPNVDFQSA